MVLAVHLKVTTQSTWYRGCCTCDKMRSGFHKNRIDDIVDSCLGYNLSVATLLTKGLYAFVNVQNLHNMQAEEALQEIQVSLAATVRVWRGMYKVCNR